MIVGKVVGTVVSTRKRQDLVGSKFLIVEPLEGTHEHKIVAVDDVGAGIGEIVLVVTGSTARWGSGKPVDALIVGIVDDKL